jgi:hypothetical protein
MQVHLKCFGLTKIIRFAGQLIYRVKCEEFLVLVWQPRMEFLGSTMLITFWGIVFFNFHF